MFAAYVLIDLSVEVDFPDALKAIRAIPGVKQAHLAVGPNDCIAFIESGSQQAAMQLIQAIREVEGVTRTDTRPVAEL
jgi:DNA-binding Lrp family transcriptional regulator